MKKICLRAPAYLLLLMVAAVASCDGQSKPNNLKNDKATPEGSVENALPIDE
jgi:hypothetical protein